VNGLELCDDGNTFSFDGCNQFCVPEVCGDGFVDIFAESCDDGNLVSGDGCSDICQIEP
jgi:cysteine-rich repeat protein